MNKLHAEVGEYKKLISNTDAKIDALRQQASEKSMKIEELRAQLLRYEECSLQSVFFTPMKTATDNEIKKLSELIVTLNARLDNERQKYEELDKSNRKLKERNKRLEKRITLLEDELKVLREASKRGSKASKTLLTRESTTFDPFGESFMSRKPSVPVFEKPSVTSSSGDGHDGLEKEDLKYKLELAEEKLKIMEDKLKMIEEEKQDDYNTLTEMIQNSKQLFNEALAVLRRDRCQCNL